MILNDYTEKKRREIGALCGKIYFQNQLREAKLQVEKKNFHLYGHYFEHRGRVIRSPKLDL